MANQNLVLQLLITAKDNASAAVGSLFHFIDRTTSATANKIREAFSGALSALASTETAASFEETMARVQAVMRPTAADFDALREKAAQMGRETRYTATEAAEGLEILAKAGLSAKDAIITLPHVLNLAQGASISLADAAGYVVDTLTQFGLAADQAGRVTDVFTKAASSANLTVGDLGQAMKYVGPAANSAGLSLEKTAAIMDVLAQGGLRADMAGTSLRDLLQDLNNPASTARESLYKLGINTNNLTEVIEGLRKVGPAGAQAIQDFGVRSATAMRLLVTAGADGIKGFEDGIRSATGYAASAREIMDKTLKGAMFGLSSAWEGLEIALKSPWLEPLQKGLRGLSSALNDITASGKVQAFGEGIVGVFEKAASAVAAVSSNMTAVAAGMATALSALLAPAAISAGAAIASMVSVIRTVGVAMTASAVATDAMAAATALLNRALTFFTGPVGLVVGALSAGAAAMALFWKEEDRTKLATDALAVATDVYIKKLKGQTEAQNKLALIQLDKGLGALREELTLAANTYDRMNGKIGETVIVYDELGGRAKSLQVTEESLAEAKARLETATDKATEAEKRRALIVKELATQEQNGLPGMAQRNAQLETYRDAVEKARAAEEKAATAVKNTVAGTEERAAAEEVLRAALEKGHAADTALTQAEAKLDRARMDAQKGMTANLEVLAGIAQKNTLVGTAQESMGQKVVEANRAFKLQEAAMLANAAAGTLEKDATEKRNTAYNQSLNVSKQLETILNADAERTKQRAAAAEKETAVLEAQATVAKRYEERLVELAQQQGTALEIEKALVQQQQATIRAAEQVAAAKKKEADEAKAYAEVLENQYKAALLNVGLSTQEIAKSKAAADQAASLAEKKREVAESSALIAQKTREEIVSIAGVTTAKEKELTAQNAVLEAMGRLATARGDANEAAKVAAQIASVETEKAKQHAEVMKEEAVLRQKELADLEREYALKLELTHQVDDDLAKRIASAQSRSKIADDEAKAAQKDIELKQQQQRQAEIMAGPIGQLQRLYEGNAAALALNTAQDKRYYDAQIASAKADEQAAQAKGDVVAASEAAVKSKTLEADQAQALANDIAAEANNQISLLEAKKLAVLASDESYQAKAKEIDQLNLSIEQQKENIQQSYADADAKKAEAAAAKEAAAAQKEAAEAQKEQEEAAKASKAQSEAMSSILSILADRMNDLSPAARKAFDGFAASTDIASASVQDLSDRMMENQRILSDNATARSVGGYLSWLDLVQNKAITIENSFLAQKIAVEKAVEALNTYTDGGRLTAEAQQALALKTDDVRNRFSLLNDEDLSTLRQAIDDATSRMDELRQASEDALSAAQQALLEEQGNKVGVLQIQQKEKELELQQKINEAKAAGDAEAIRNLQTALDLEQQTYALKIKKAQTDATSSSTSTSSKSSGGGEYTLHLKVGSETLNTTTGTDPTSFLRAIENAKRSAA